MSENIAERFRELLFLLAMYMRWPMYLNWLTSRVLNLNSFKFQFLWDIRLRRQSSQFVCAFAVDSSKFDVRDTIHSEP